MASISRRSAAALPLALALITLPAFAEDEPSWLPPEVGSSPMDTITLKTGETLYGDFEGLRDRKVFFDSDEFDDLDFKWNKVRSLELITPHIFRLDDGEVTGTAEMRDEVVRVRTSSGEVIDSHESKSSASSRVAI
jgi:hypothetical protein